MNDQRLHRGGYFLIALFALLAILVLFVLSPFLSVIGVAIVTVVILSPLYGRILKNHRVKGRRGLATSLTIIFLLLVVFVPIFAVGFILFQQASDLLQYVKSGELESRAIDYISAIEDGSRQILLVQDIEIDSERLTQIILDVAASGLDWMVSTVSSLIPSLANLFMNGLIFLIVLATMLPNFEDLKKRVQEVSPLDVDITQIYLSKGEAMIVSVIKGVFLLAIVQGLIMGVAYWLAGVPFAAFFTILSAAFAILPIVGISFIVVPMAFVLLLTGNVSSAIIVLIGFYVFANPLDIWLRPKLVSEEAYLNFTLMLMALFGGLAVGGLLGMIYGPVIMILFITTIDIFSRYFGRSQEQSGSSELDAVQDETLPDS